LLTIPLFLSTAVMLLFYLLSSLYDERKDRSILFWKSLPVSDAATVLSKLLVATVVVPLGIFLVWVVTSLLYTAVWDMRLAMGFVAGPPFAWDIVAWLKVDALILTFVVMSSLWYAPVIAYLMLVSAWARRNPFLWAVLPPLILAVLERITFDSTHLGHLFGARMAGVLTSFGVSDPQGEAFKSAMLHTPFGDLVSIPSVFDLIDYRRLFANFELWAGVAVAVVFVYVAIRMRRYRDDT
jgi:ABC-2 type transport system permease protein